jgi:hypothetical protein
MRDAGLATWKAATVINQGAAPGFIEKSVRPGSSR